MCDTSINDASEVVEKPVQESENVVFPPFPDPSDSDFEEDISEEERAYYKNKFQDLNIIRKSRLHCTACDRHLGCSARNESRMRTHPMLRTLVCHTCHTFYNSGEFDKGDDGSELYCRWCGQGGQVYCCSDCPHVFCAKCIKRNLGAPKIKEIEELDDWNCFKCNPKCLWDLRAVCWAVLRYCDLKNKITYKTQDPDLKEIYQKDCGQDLSECCKSKVKRKDKLETKKKEGETSGRKSASSSLISKIPPTIQVKKFASINLEEVKNEKKPQKRPASPKAKQMVMKNPIAIAPKIQNPPIAPSVPKRMKLPSSPLMNPVRFNNDIRKPIQVYGGFIRTPRPKGPQLMYNGYNNANHSFNIHNDNINLSLESLTQGLDMAAVAAMASIPQDDDVVCTPDFPMEPLCEVTDDPGDDDVQCITPGPIVAPKAPPPLVPRAVNTLPDLSSDNIIQMTDNDVTVNATTGGLKFRVDPQTLSSNKMYRLPDGRIFAINANPNMPGGYSATIVAVTDNVSGKMPPKGATYAAKLSAVPSPAVATPPPLKNIPRKQPNRSSKNNKRNSTPKSAKVNKGTETPSRHCDLNIPVEWYRHNLIDAVDALEYSLVRLNQLKKETTTLYLRTRSLQEMRNLHRSLDSLLKTSSNRFNEIRENLNKELKNYIAKKNSSGTISDDDDVEILPDIDNDDPIFIDENSLDSNSNVGQEVDLTGLGSSEHDSSGRSIEKNEPLSNNTIDSENLKNKDGIHDYTNIKNNSESFGGDALTDKAKENGEHFEEEHLEDIEEIIDNSEYLAKDRVENMNVDEKLDEDISTLNNEGDKDSEKRSNNTAEYNALDNKDGDKPSNNIEDENALDNKDSDKLSNNTENDNALDNKVGDKPSSNAEDDKNVLNNKDGDNPSNCTDNDNALDDKGAEKELDDGKDDNSLDCKDDKSLHYSEDDSLLNDKDGDRESDKSDIVLNDTEKDTTLNDKNDTVLNDNVDTTKSSDKRDANALIDETDGISLNDEDDETALNDNEDDDNQEASKNDDDINEMCEETIENLLKDDNESVSNEYKNETQSCETSSKIKDS